MLNEIYLDWDYFDLLGPDSGKGLGVGEAIERRLRGYKDKVYNRAKGPIRPALSVSVA